MSGFFWLQNCSIFLTRERNRLSDLVLPSLSASRMFDLRLRSSRATLVTHRLRCSSSACIESGPQRSMCFGYQELFSSGGSLTEFAGAPSAHRSCLTRDFVSNLTNFSNAFLYFPVKHHWSQTYFFVFISTNILYSPLAGRLLEREASSREASSRVLNVESEVKVLNFRF